MVTCRVIANFVPRLCDFMCFPLTTMGAEWCALLFTTAAWNGVGMASVFPYLKLESCSESDLLLRISALPWPPAAIENDAPLVSGKVDVFLPLGSTGLSSTLNSIHCLLRPASERCSTCRLCLSTRGLWWGCGVQILESEWDPYVEWEMSMEPEVNGVRRSSWLCEVRSWDLVPDAEESLNFLITTCTPSGSRFSESLQERRVDTVSTSGVF